MHAQGQRGLRCWASAPTGTSGSTSRVRRWGSRTRVAALTEQTRQDNARFFESVDEVPRHVITRGPGTISAARHLVLIATGSRKAVAVERPVTSNCPASVLRFPPHVTVVVDEAAATRLENAEFYRYALKCPPAQQKY